MLLILIPIAWLALLVLVVCLCQVAAVADAESFAPRSANSIGERLTLAPRRLISARGALSHPRRPHAQAPSSSAGRRRLAAHGLR
jgi:hypothetical protein